MTLSNQCSTKVTDSGDTRTTHKEAIALWEVPENRTAIFSPICPKGAYLYRLQLFESQKYTSSTSETFLVSALQAFYNNVGKSYNTMTKSVHAGGPERIVEAAGHAIRPGASVLDLATGTGKAALAAAAKVGETGRVVGIDISDEFIEIARKASVVESSSCSARLGIWISKGRTARSGRMQ